MRLFILVFCFALLGCAKDNNSKPIYGKESGLPANCRAYVQVSINDWRNKKYSTEDIMNGLERNCGENGSLWDYKP
ncbi:kynureninase [Acinetobacter sp. ANC 4636]|uniref:hypothetical protein n=1 Tax=Acinetobacter sp. ANC 3789 TaxID=1217714 RepID=UPI0002CFBDB1|nr:hypothetical protein [Acinetobacter sp. ANC 3789]ENU80609.1 hypothetical protein F975_01663 [Acinetobacter sp. ANC 3789]